MNLTAEQVKNLNILADFMDRLNDPQFTMSRFVHRCDAPACALGWACTIPALKAAGLDMDVLENHAATGAAPMANAVFGNYLDLFASAVGLTVNTPQDWAAYCRAFLKANGYEAKDAFKLFLDRVMIPVEITDAPVM